MTAIRLESGESISLDGRLDEDVWQRAVPATDFLQQDPHSGAEASERTEVRVLFDRGHLYLGVTCYDTEPDRLLGNQMQRDQSFAADDRFMWTIDTFLDGRTGYFFEINPSGAMGDGVLSGAAATTGESALNKQWDGIWTARVRRTATGWTAEIELPFRTLNFDPQVPAWGINFQRTIRRRNEESQWSGHLRNQGLFRMGHAGLLTGLEDIHQGIGLDLRPYLLGVLTAAPGRGAPRSTAYADAGLADVIYSLTPGLRANFTVTTASRKRRWISAPCESHAFPPLFSGEARVLPGRSRFRRLLAGARQRFVELTHFNAGIRIYDVQDPAEPREVAYYVPARTGEIEDFMTWRGGTTEGLFVEWDRNLMWVSTHAGTLLYVDSTTGQASARAS